MDLERLKKLKVLAERGSPGEKDNAKLLLDRLCKKYGVSLDDVKTSDQKIIRWFKHKRGGHSRELLVQCIAKALNQSTFTTSRRGRNGGWRSEIGVECTAAEAIEIELDFSFYSAALEVEIDRLFNMFIQRNDVFSRSGEPSDSDSDKKLTSEDIDMYNALKKHSRTLQIEGKKRDKNKE